jgi:hypothetical protein
MRIFSWLKAWWSRPKSHWCGGPLGEHEWRAPKNEMERFPVCVKCGAKCYWLKGYVTNFGTVNHIDRDALSVANRDWIKDVPWYSRP